MRLESVLAATGGSLLNDPFVTRFENVTLLTSKVTRGTLFIAKDPDEIPTAVQEGAYGILTEFSPAILDEEIAWIRVPSLQEALPQLLRLWLVENPRRFLYLSPSVFDYAEALCYDHRFLFLDGSPEQISEAVLSSSETQTLLVCEKLLLDRLGADYRKPGSMTLPYRILRSTLFETTALIEEEYFERLPVPSCTFEDFIEALSFLKEAKAAYQWQHLHPSRTFDPLFFDGRFEEKPFGSTDRVVILTDDPDSCPCLASFEKAKWLPRILLLPSTLKLGCDIKMEIERYEDEKSLFRLLKKRLKHPGYTMIAPMRRESFLSGVTRHLAVARHNSTKGLF